MFDRGKTRDIAVQAQQLIQAHITECRDMRQETRRDLCSIKDDLDAKHKENKDEFRVIRETSAAIQWKMFWGITTVLGTIVGKFFFDTIHFQIHFGP